MIAMLVQACRSVSAYSFWADADDDGATQFLGFSHSQRGAK